LSYNLIIKVVITFKMPIGLNIQLLTGEHLFNIKFTPAGRISFELRNKKFSKSHKL
jgi:hypothetical protein